MIKNLLKARFFSKTSHDKITMFARYSGGLAAFMFKRIYLQEVSSSLLFCLTCNLVQILLRSAYLTEGNPD